MRAVLVSHIRQLMPQLADCIRLETGENLYASFRRIGALIVAAETADPDIAGSLISMVASAWLAMVRAAAFDNTQLSNAAQDTSELDRVAKLRWDDVMTALALGVESTDTVVRKTVAQLGVWILQDWRLCGKFTTAYACCHGDGGNAWHALDALMEEFQGKLE